MGRPSTREKLLDTAEHLFAEHGVEGVSLRTINAEAGLSPAALHYHFGSQQALVEALLERHMPALMARRRELFDALVKSDETITTRRVLHALIQPQAGLLGAGGADAQRYMRFIHRLWADGDLDHGFVLARWPGGVDRLMPLLLEANAPLPVSCVEDRLRITIGVMLHSLAHGIDAAGGDLDVQVSALLDFLTAGFEASITAMKEPA